MPRRFLAFVFLFYLTSYATANGPAALLDQAIREAEAASTDTSGRAESGENAADLMSEADRLARQQRYNEAIELYRKAYKLKPSDNTAYLRLLVAKRAAGLLDESDRQAMEMLRASEMLLIEHTLSAVRLSMHQAREALRTDDVVLAGAKAREAEQWLASLPADVDVSAYRRDLRALTRAAQKRDHMKQGRVQDDDRVQDSPWREDVVTPQRQGPSDSATDPSLTVGALNENGRGSDHEQRRYVPSGKIVDVESTENGDFEKSMHRAQRQLREQTDHDRMRWYYELMNAADPPSADLTYPADWPETTQRRARYRDGVVFQSQPFTGADGRTYTTAIYDLAELAHPVPNFYPYYSGDRQAEINAILDRQVLRERSFIFRGDAADLAAGIPLLQYFGGIDNAAITSAYDAREVERIRRHLEEALRRTPDGE